jgi:hypothetical protein
MFLVNKNAVSNISRILPPKKENYFNGRYVVSGRNMSRLADLDMGIKSIGELGFPIWQNNAFASPNSRRVLYNHIPNHITRTLLGSVSAMYFQKRFVSPYTGASIGSYFARRASSGGNARNSSSYTTDLNLQGDFNITIKLSMFNNNGINTFINKGNASITRSWSFEILADRRLSLTFVNSSNVTFSANSTIPIQSFTSDERWFGVSRVQSTDTVTFFESVDGITWTQLGATASVGLSLPRINATQGVGITCPTNGNLSGVSNYSTNIYKIFIKDSSIINTGNNILVFNPEDDNPDDNLVYTSSTHTFTIVDGAVGYPTFTPSGLVIDGVDDRIHSSLPVVSINSFTTVKTPLLIVVGYTDRVEVFSAISSNRSVNHYSRNPILRTANSNSIVSGAGTITFFGKFFQNQSMHDTVSQVYSYLNSLELISKSSPPDWLFT